MVVELLVVSSNMLGRPPVCWSDLPLRWLVVCDSCSLSLSLLDKATMVCLVELNNKMVHRFKCFIFEMPTI